MTDFRLQQTAEDFLCINPLKKHDCLLNKNMKYSTESTLSSTLHELNMGLYRKYQVRSMSKHHDVQNKQKSFIDLVHKKQDLLVNLQYLSIVVASFPL